MSTDRSRLVSSIRRIVLTDPDLSSALDDWQNRGDQASSTGTGTSDAERDRLCCDGSTSDNPNPGADTRDTSEGGQDGLNEDDPALLDSGPGSLTGVTDCATGEPICFDGSDWLPPEGWDGPTDPPLDPDFDTSDDYYWELSFQGAPCSGSYEDKVKTIGQAEDLAESGCGSRAYCRTSYVTDPNTGEITAVLGVYASTSGSCDTNTTRIQYNRQDCNTTECEGDEGVVFPTEDEKYEDSWPEDGCTNLSIKNGSIVGSKYDPENDGTYSKPMSEIELCDGSGNSFLLRPSASGGWKTIKSLDGEPDGAVQNGWLYSAYGDVIQQITPSEFSDPKV